MKLNEYFIFSKSDSDYRKRFKKTPTLVKNKEFTRAFKLNAEVDPMEFLSEGEVIIEILKDVSIENDIPNIIVEIKK